MQFTRDNVDYKISYSKMNSGRREDGVSIQSLKANFEAGQKKLGFEVIDQDGHLDYSFNGDGPGMDDENERIRFLESWTFLFLDNLDNQVSLHFIHLYRHTMALLSDGKFESDFDSDSDNSDESDDSDGSDREGLTMIEE